MVVTRRSRSNNSLAADDNDAGNSIASASGRSRVGGVVPPPPPPPPPIGASAMAAIPEEIDTNNNDNTVVVLPPAPPVQAESSTTQQMQYLQVRTPTTFQSIQPSRINRRRHHHRRQPSQPTNNNKNGPPNSQQQYTRSTRNKGSKHSTSSSNHNIEELLLGEIVKVLIPTNGFQSEKQLADCLSQASAATTASSTVNSSSAGGSGSYYYDDDDDYSLDEYYDTDRNSTTSSNVIVAGMFRESDRVFVPLSVIYAQPTLFVGEILCIQRPPPPKPKRQLLNRGQTSGDSLATTKRRSILITFLEMMGIILVSVASYKLYSTASCIDWETVLQTSLYKIEHVFFTILNFPFYVFDIVIEFPLRELYRHGPSIIGWEGEPLPKICARITYHGDEIFWSRNIEECTRIYQAKELAAMQVRKPIVIGFIVCVLFYMIKSIVEARALRRRERIDPNMVETYRAIQMLTRQLRRAANGR